MFRLETEQFIRSESRLEDTGINQSDVKKVTEAVKINAHDYLFFIND